MKKKQCIHSPWILDKIKINTAVIINSFFVSISYLFVAQTKSLKPRVPREGLTQSLLLTRLSPLSKSPNEVFISNNANKLSFYVLIMSHQ